MRLTGWFGVKTPRRKRFKFCLIELFPIANVPSTGDYCRNAVIAMGVRRNLCMRGNSQHDRVHARFIRITFEYNSLNSANAGTPGAGIALLWKLVLGGSEALFAKVARRGVSAGCCSNLRRVEEGANKRHGFRWALFHQPMPGASDDRLSNIGRNVPHDHCLERTKRLFSADSKYGHRQLAALENFIILCVLRKSSELG